MDVYMIAFVADENNNKVGYRIFDAVSKRTKDISIVDAKGMVTRGFNINNVVNIAGRPVVNLNTCSRYPTVVNGTVRGNGMTMVARVGKKGYVVVNGSGRTAILDRAAAKFLDNKELSTNFTFKDDKLIDIHKSIKTYKSYPTDAVINWEPYEKIKQGIVKPVMEEQDTVKTVVDKPIASAKVLEVKSNNQEEVKAVKKKIKREPPAEPENPYLRKLSYGTYVVGEGFKSIPEGAFEGEKRLKIIEIAEGVERIENFAFYGCDGIESIRLPDTLLYIGEYALSMCNNIESIVIPSDVEVIGEGAFSDCEKLNSVLVGASVETLGEHVFSRDKKLSKLMIFSERIKVIPVGMCNGCVNLKSFNMPRNIESIGEKAFYQCKEIRIEVALGRTDEIGAWAFSGTGITKVVLRACKNIGKYAFENCKDLRILHIGQEVDTIGRGILNGTNKVKYDGCKNGTLKKIVEAQRAQR